MALVARLRSNDFVERFSRKRCSWGSVALIAAWIGSWVAWQHIPGLPHFDMPPNGERYGLLNFLMSVEACISMPILWMGMERGAEKDRQAALKRHKEEVAAVAEVMVAVRDLLTRLTEMSEDVETIEDHVAVIAEEIEEKSDD